ncbi:MAG: hypothetical protein EPN97_16150 [Alphaproteobacteria bacterium]|nr:MAG: hypothetical protein EPN97_16150 [Alphaproteobacteria bacterium]
MSDKLLEVGADNLAETVARIRQNDPTLTEFKYHPYQGPQTDWSNPDVQARHLAAIAEALAHNHTVRKFEVPNCDVKGATAGRIFQRLLAKNRGLDELNIICTDLGVEGMREVCKGLAANNTLGAIKFVFAKMGDEGMALLSKAVAESKSLRELRVENCEVGDEGAKHFAKALKVNKSLKAFYLPNNAIADEGIGSICDAMKANDTVETLGLGHCGMRVVGAKEGKEQVAYRKLCDLIRTTRSIVEVDLSFTPFSAQRNDISELGAAIAQNKSIADLRMECWALFPDAFKKFTAAMKGNKTLATHWGADLQHSFTNETAEMAVAAMAAALKDNPNFVRFYHGAGEDTEMKTLLTRNRQEIGRLIEKIENPKAKLTAEDARKIKACVSGIYYAAEIFETDRRDKASYYWQDNRVAAEAYAKDVLQKADKKCAAAGFGGLSIPALFRPAAAKAAEQKPFVPAKTKVDLNKLKPETMTAKFGKSAGSRLASVAYKAASAGQTDELMDYLAKNCLSLGAKECLYKPAENDPTLIEVIAAQGKLARVMTAENWKNDIGGIDDVAAVLAPNVLADQLKDSPSVEEVKWSIEASTIRKGRAPIRIGLRKG